MQSLVLHRDQKRKTGQFYTPEDIAAYMIEELAPSKESTVLDSACGCGVFLVKAFLFLKEKYGSADVVERLYGVDINQEAVGHTQENLIRLSGEKFRKTVLKNIRLGNSVCLKRETFNWEQEFPEVFKQGGFDYIIGNPPYVTVGREYNLDYDKRTYEKVVDGVVNVATLMILTGYDLLKSGGSLSFLLPKSLTRVASYARLRNFLLSNTKLIQLFDVGLAFSDVRGEQIILTFKKRIPKDAHVSIAQYIDVNKSFRAQKQIKIKQEEFKSSGVFLILPDKKLYQIVETLQKIPQTIEHISSGQICRGVPVPGEFLKFELEKDDAVELIKGNSIKKFSVIPEFFINKCDLNKLGDNRYKRLLVKKIIMQNIYSAESGVKAIFDQRGVLTGETVTNIIIDQGDPLYILGLLYSKLMTFFITFGLFNGSKLTMHADRQYVGQVPVVFGENRHCNRVIELIGDASRDPMEWKKYMREVDELIYKIYGVDKGSIKAIDQSLKSIMSKRSYW